MVNVESVTKEFPFYGSGITKWLGGGASDASDDTKKERRDGGESDHGCI